MTTQRSKNIDEERKNGESRYMTSEKKRYYLASADENIQMLINQQKEELTRVLIELKSQYDKLTKETTIKKRETDELDKKIAMLELMDSKTKKKFDEVNSNNENMKNAIEIKKKKKEEEMYTKKTLSKQIENLKTDILLVQKEINMLENETKKLNKKYERERSKQNEIKEKYNAVYSRIKDQNQQNKFEKNEQELQLKYYKTIIDQKYQFIQSADERKERQIKIAQEAKNDSQDKQEVEKRRELELVMLYNTFLRHKMDEQLKANEKIEKTFQEIRDICGTANLKLIVEKMLNKDKVYNMCVQTVAEKEKEKIQLKGELAELQKQFIDLKNDLLIKEESEENSKTISTIQTSRIEEDEAELLKKEKDLTKTLNDLREKHKGIVLVYDKVCENIKFLCEYQKESCSDIKEPEKKEEDNNQETRPEETKAEETQPVETKPEEEKKEELHLGDEPKEEEEKKEEEKKDSEVPKGEEEKKEEAPIVSEEKKEGDDVNPETIPNLQTNAETEAKIEVKETPEETELINEYNIFLQQALKTFDILFLCHSKHDFLNLMREKGIEMQQRQENQGMRVNKKRRTTRRKMTANSRVAKTEPNARLSNEEEDNDEKYNPDKDILLRFIREMKKSRDEFVIPEKDKPKVVIKKPINN